MSGFLVHQGATIMCTHAGQAMPTQASSRIKVSGQPVVLLPTAYTIAGCSLPPPPTANGPCVTAGFLNGTTRVLADGVPIALSTSKSICTPTAATLVVAATQTRVQAT